MDHVELESSITDQSRIRRFLQGLLEQWSFLYYDGAIAASRYLEHEIQRRVLRQNRSNPILYLPFAFDPSACSPDIGKVEGRRAEARGRKTIAFMGGLHANYGVRELIAAYRNSPELCRSSRLIFFGRGPEADYIRSQPRDPSNGAWIEYAGFLDEPDLMAYLFACDVLVSPLRNTVQDWARCPSKTYIYMATRRPIVTAPVGENREALGDLGFYYEPGRESSLSSALARALAASSELSYDLGAHTWAERTNRFVRWLEGNFHEEKS